MTRLTLDTADAVYFYEQDHYYLSNFSSFKLTWQDTVFMTSEHAYQATRFPRGTDIRIQVRDAPSAHEAFRLAQKWKPAQRPEWDQIKVHTMLDILRAKTQQHDYVREKLLRTGDAEIIENSWRDGFWGWGEDRKGGNMLGRLWMKVRRELRS